ncbi:unnamed protein product [Effrenium voratum]|nr:unnamed protein product [Effrenium voratum]
MSVSERTSKQASCKSAAFGSFYQANLVETGLLEEGEWVAFLDSLSKPLPTTFWITPTDRDADRVRGALRRFSAAADESSEGDGQRPCVRTLPWLPEDMGWRVDIPKVLLRKDGRFKPLHEMLIQYTAQGTINRMEEVSMLPVALLDIRAGHLCLDTCASPGSKTAQMLSCLSHANFKKWGRGLESISSDEVKQCANFLQGRIDYSLQEGCVVANEISAERAGMLVHQIARHQRLYPLALFTSHDARFFPSIRAPDGRGVRFDRILCDVMCSSDGTLRKAPHLWREWSSKHSLELHPEQLAVARRAARLLKTGGRMVYSTCSFSPVENEAVVAELLGNPCLALVDVREQLALRTAPGLPTWKVAVGGRLFGSFAEAEAAGAKKLLPGFFPPEEESLRSELKKCVRVLPHHNDTGGFFVAVLEKVAEASRESDTTLGYDSALDSDGEEAERRKQLERLEEAVATGRSEQERAKAEARRERARTSGSLARELARYCSLEAMPEQAAALRSAYGLHETLPESLLFSRHHLELGADGALVQTHQGEANQLLLLAKSAAEILRFGTGGHAKRKLKVIAGGLRVFEKDRFEVPARSTHFRFAQEALELVLPYVGRRVVKLEDPADAQLLLSRRDAAVAVLRSPGSAGLEALSPGGCILLLRTATSEWLPVSALRTQKAVNLFVNDLSMPAVRQDFEPLLGAPEVGFWQELSRRKLDLWRLDSSNVPLTAYYEASQASGVPAKCFLQKDAFECGPAPSGAAKVLGELKNFNTEEEFRTFLGNAEARQASLAEAVNQICSDIASGAALQDPSKLRRLMLCTFADLKKYHFSYLLTLPALRGSPWAPVSRQAADREQVAAVAKGLREQDFGGLCLLVRGSGWSLRPLAELPSVQVDSEEDLITVFVDPSSEEAPGWPLQNALVLLAKYRPGKRRILAFRDPQLGGQGYSSGPLRSQLLTFEVPPEAASASDCRAGWSKIATMDLTRFMDSKTVAANAVDLNIKLMKWRVLPALEPEKMKDLRVLLLGSGTLGCGVARALMGWGCRHMTFVDGGKVSFSNPVRQSLFTHKDAAEGRKKATAAREAVEAILPDAEVADVVLDIPMPGHPHQSAEGLRSNIAKLQELVDAHDVICMLTDSRESRWLPSLMVAAAQSQEGKTPPLGLTVALGFDSFLVSRQTYRNAPAACYFCNDVTAPSDSLAFRTLDQQCTVTRPGISGLASNCAVELLAALTQHPDGFAAESSNSSNACLESPLGGVPHQVRGFAADYALSPTETEPFVHCICCSQKVLQQYAAEGVPFIEKVIADSSILEEISGLAEMKAGMCEAEVEAFDDFDDL